ncbi:MAG TPA: succinate--CoA ligase subunit alpha, partial [Candidatus Acidoferrum sp.]|nr:succinate--CoA ligase subunit alpha [Candidatus Acidoferrum sp.]
MSILLDEKTRVIIQGVTGREGSFHARRMQEYGTRVVGGVTPGKGGQAHDGMPVFDTVAEARQATGAEASITFVPTSAAVDSLVEAIRSGLRLVVCTTDGIPVHDMLLVGAMAREAACSLIGPNCPGLITPGRSKLGFMPSHVYSPGPIGVMGKSGSLSYEVAYELTRAGLGQSTVVGIGGDPVKGYSFVDLLPLFAEDPETQAIVLIGEIGGPDEERAAGWLERNRIGKPVIAYVVGHTAPPFVKMGHPGTLFVKNDRSYAEKVERL